MPENNEITSTHEIAEGEWDRDTEPRDVQTSMVATREPENKGIEFHVSMRSYTQRDMEALIVEAAARQIVGNHNEKTLTKAIEAKCIELINARLSEVLQNVTQEIIDQPIMPSFGDKKPVTMREFIGLVGREYLTTRVDWSGRSKTDHHFDGNRTTRIELLVDQFIGRQFKNEIEKATNTAIYTLRSEIQESGKQMVAAELARIRVALADATKAPK